MKLALVFFLSLLGSATLGFASDDSRFFKQKPVELLQYLKTHCCEAVTVSPAPAGWITSRDVRELKKFLKDESPAAPVYNPFSSKLCTEKSSVRREALYLIRGYLEKRYPPDLCSTDFDLKSVRVPTK